VNNFLAGFTNELMKLGQIEYKPPHETPSGREYRVGQLTQQIRKERGPSSPHGAVPGNLASMQRARAGTLSGPSRTGPAMVNVTKPPAPIPRPLQAREYRPSPRPGMMQGLTRRR